MTTSAVTPGSQTSPSSPPLTPLPPSASSASSANTATSSSSPPGPLASTSNVSSGTTATTTTWEKFRRLIASNITAFVLTLLGLITGVVFFVLGYLPAEAGLVLASKSYQVSMWKDCRDRPDMHETEICKPYLDMTLGSIAKRGLNTTFSSISSVLWKSPSALDGTDPQKPQNIGYMFLKTVAILAVINAPWTAQIFSTPPRPFHWDYQRFAFIANCVLFLGLEGLLVQRFPNTAVTILVKIHTYVVGSHFVSAVVTHGGADFTSYTRSHPDERYLGFISKALVRAVTGCAAIVGCILLIVPFHQLPQSSKIIPTVRNFLDGFKWMMVGIAVLGIGILVILMANSASFDKMAVLDDPDEESGVMSSIKQAPATIYNVVREILLGMYRAVRGPEIGRKYPPSVYREKTE